MSRQRVKLKSCIFTVQFIEDFLHLPFNLQPYVNKLLVVFFFFSSVIKNKTLLCLDWLLVALPLQNQRKRGFLVCYYFNELSVITQ